MTYSSSKEITASENITEGTYSSETKDENAISVSGNIVVDSISKLTMNLTNNSMFTGAINNSNSTNSNINLNGYKLYIDGTLFTK